MTTINQIRRFKRIPKKSFIFCTAFKGNPQLRGRYLKTLHITPRKPNSAIRKVGRVLLSNKKKVFAKIAGSKMYPIKYASVLVMGHGYKDTPSVKYSIIRGKLDCPTFMDRINKRSLYAIKNKFIIYIKKELRKKKMFQQHSLISIFIISIFPFLLFWMSTLYTIFFSKNGKNIISRELYECGFKTINDNNINIEIQFSLIGLIFLIYEMEIIIFVPLFLNYFGYSLIYLIIILFSLLIIIFSYIYEWEKYGLYFTF